MSLLLLIFLGYVWFYKVSKKEKTVKENDFLMFGFNIENSKKKKFKYN